MAITRCWRAERHRTDLRVVLVTSLVLVATMVAVTGAPHPAGATYGCQISGYGCAIGGYDASTMNDNWATKYYGPSSRGGIGNPPHNCTLYAAWMLAHNGLVDPGHTWGYASQWGQTLAAATNSTPATGSIAWFRGPGMGHVAYVAQVDWSNNTVFLVSDNYNGGSGGYTSSGWMTFSQVSGFIHLSDVAAVGATGVARPTPTSLKPSLTSLRFE